MTFSPIVPVLIVSSTFIAIAGFGLHAAVASPPSLMSRADERDASLSLETASRAGLAACGVAERHAASVCRAQARGDARIRRADLEARYRGTAAAAGDARLARAHAAYETDSASCGNLLAGDRTACRLAARSARSANILILSAAALASN